MKRRHAILLASLCLLAAGGVAAGVYLMRSGASPAPAVPAKGGATAPNWVDHYEKMTEDGYISAFAIIGPPEFKPTRTEVDRALDIYIKRGAVFPGDTNLQSEDAQLQRAVDFAIATIVPQIVLHGKHEERGSEAKRDEAFTAAMNSPSISWRLSAIRLFGDTRAITPGIVQALALAAVQDTDEGVRKLAQEHFERYHIHRGAEKGMAWFKLHEAMSGNQSLTTAEIIECVRLLNRER